MGWPWSVRQCDCAWCIPNRTEFGVIGGHCPRAGIADADTDEKVWKSGRGSGSRDSSCFRCSQLYHWICSDRRRRLFGERGESVTCSFFTLADKRLEHWRRDAWARASKCFVVATLPEDRESTYYFVSSAICKP